jgi:hypothetical protein
MKVFIIYAREDWEIAERVWDDLKRAGIDTNQPTYSPASLRTAVRVFGSRLKRNACNLSRKGATEGMNPAALASSRIRNVPISLILRNIAASLASLSSNDDNGILFFQRQCQHLRFSLSQIIDQRQSGHAYRRTNLYP